MIKQNAWVSQYPDLESLTSNGFNSNCYFGNEGWDSQEADGALLSIQAKLRLEIIPISETEGV